MKSPSPARLSCCGGFRIPNYGVDVTTMGGCIAQTAPKSGVGPGDEIEITPQMIEAGVDVLLGFCPDTAVGDVTDRRMVAEIFASMATARRLRI